MSYLLDTDIVVEYLKNNESVVNKVNALNDLRTTTITLCELYYGVYNSSQREKHLSILLKFLSSVDLLTLDADSSLTFGLIKTELRKKGLIIGDFDITIASIALTNNMILLTRNIKHFEHIDELRIIEI